MKSARFERVLINSLASEESGAKLVALNVSMYSWRIGAAYRCCAGGLEECLALGDRLQKDLPSRGHQIIGDRA
jgi:hypothetical protein